MCCKTIRDQLGVRCAAGGYNVVALAANIRKRYGVPWRLEYMDVCAFLYLSQNKQGGFTAFGIPPAAILASDMVTSKRSERDGITIHAYESLVG